MKRLRYNNKNNNNIVTFFHVLIVHTIEEVTVIFHFPSPSGDTMALAETQPLTEISTRCISWGVKLAGA